MKIAITTILLTSMLQISGLAVADPNSNTPAKVFEPAIAQVKANTNIPILLPSELPAPLKENDIHFSVGNGKHNKYEITLFYEEGAGYAAFVGFFSGEAIGKTNIRGKKIKLANGITGYFSGKSCGGSCSASQIKWRLDNVLYTLQLKLAVKSKDEEEKALTTAANSAILGGAR